MANNPGNAQQLSRRVFVRNGTLILAATSMRASSVFANDKPEPLRIGLITDLHYADKRPAGSRHYRETLDKLAEAGTQFEQQPLSFLVELGDLVDAADSVDVERGYLKTINKAFSPLCKDRHYVLGNHCVDTLTKAEFLAGVEQEKSYYSFDRNGFHFIVLDACFRSDGEPYGRKNSKWTDANIPPAELEWLKADLAKHDKPTVVFAHQRLDEAKRHSVKNAAKVRQLLEGSGNVRAVFQGHSHANELQEINGVPYCTLVAMVEGSGEKNNGYSVLSIQPDGSMELTGFRKQKSRNWKRDS